MKTELKVSDIAGYFPYSLYVTTKDKTVPMFHVAKLMYPSALSLFECEHNGEKRYDILKTPVRPTIIHVADVLPILRPLPSLYEWINHKGESFIPIKRLAEIAFPEEKKWDTIGEACVSEGLSEFCFEDGFYLQDIGNDVFTCPQTPLLDLLNEWKIDYRGLIPADLAVNVNDLKINLYA